MTNYYQHDSQPYQHQSLSSTSNNFFQMPSYTSHVSRSASKMNQQHISTTSPSRMHRRTSSNTKDSDQSLLEMLNSTVACLKQKNMDLEALGCLEQSLWLKRRMFGVDNTVVHKALSEVVLSYNSVAMQYLAQGQFDQCLAMLRKAEAITAPGNFKKCQSLQILTFNNIGCCYRKLGKLKSALKYLKEAAQIGSGCAHVKNLSITHLNLCAIQSQLGRHDLALEHAQAAIFHTQEELVSLDEGNDQGEDDFGEDRERSVQRDVLDAKTREEKIISLAVAYHNLAVELEFNERGEASLQWYKKALQLVWKYRDTNEALCASFKKIFLDAKKKYENAQKQSKMSRNHTSSGGSRPISGQRSNTRPKSAHSFSRNSSADCTPQNVSYSATVAAKCYKPNKPSTAALNYASPPTGRKTTGANSSTKHQRPSSAGHQRPRSASARRSTAASNSTQQLYGKAETDQSTNAVDLHWKRLEEEFALNTDHQSKPVSKRNHEVAPAKRPQSARTASRPGNLTHSSRNVHQDLYFPHHEDEIMDDVEAYGIIQDDDSDGDDDEQFTSMLFEKGKSHEDYTTPLGGVNTIKTIASSNRTQRSTNAQRHRKALFDSRSMDQLDKEQEEDTDERNMTAQEDDETTSAGSMGYIAENDVEVPHQRVGHMEYLRRMKKIAESIKDDLSGVLPQKAATGANFSASKQTQPKVAEMLTENQAEDIEATERTQRGSNCKVRERLERVRSDSLGNSNQITRDESASTDNITVDDASTKEMQRNEGIDVVEDKFLYPSEDDICCGEDQLIHHVAANLLQSFVRAGRIRVQVKDIKQNKVKTEAARKIQHKAKEYNQISRERRQKEEEKNLLRLQKEEAEDLAATLIQNLYRRKCRKETDILPAYTEFDDCSCELEIQEENPIGLMAEELADSTIISTSISATKDLSGANLARPTTKERENAAATHIQAFLKGFYVRQRMVKGHANRMSRMYIEQKHVSIAFHTAMALEQQFLEEISATKIQALVRGRQSRMLTEAMHIGRHAAAGKIQASFRAHRQHTVQSMDIGLRSLAVRTIQDAFRTYLARQLLVHQAIISEEHQEVQQIAATTIQHFWRKSIANRDKRLEEHEAAICIQALGRGHITRRSLKSLRASRSDMNLSKPPSAFSISASVEQLVEEEDAMETTQQDKRVGTNFSFLPPTVADMYLGALDNPYYMDAVQTNGIDFDAKELEDLDLRFEDFMLEFETCADPSTACSAMDAMRKLVKLYPEDLKTLACVVKVAYLMDQRMQDHGFWTEDLQDACFWFLHLFHDHFGIHETER